MDRAQSVILATSDHGAAASVPLQSENWAMNTIRSSMVYLFVYD